MADFDAALDRQHALAVGRGIAGDDVAHVGDDLRLGQVAAPVDAGVVKAGLVRAADEIAHRRDGAIGDHAQRPARADRPEVAGLAAEGRFDLRAGREAKAALEARQLAGLDLVQRVVAAHEQQPDRRSPASPSSAAASVARTSDFTVCASGSAELRGDIFAGALARRRRSSREPSSAPRAAAPAHRLGQLDVGGVVGIGAVDDRVLAGVGDHLELVRADAADRAVVGGDGAKGQAHALEDAHVGGVHAVVARARRVEVAVEGVGILHRELAAAHETEARPPLIAEFRLDVIEILRQRRGSFAAPGGRCR